METGKRWAASEQPKPIQNPKGGATQQWRVKAYVGRYGTGKATGTKIVEKTRDMFAPTFEEAVARQEEFIQDYLHPAKRQRKQSHQSQRPDPPLRAGSRRVAPRNATAASSRAESTKKRGPAAGSGRAGPGRGHTFASTVPIPIDELMPPVVSEKGSNWLRQHALKEKWRTERIAQLEGQLAEAKCTIQQQRETIDALREKHAQQSCAAQLGRHARKIRAMEEHPEWNEILGSGYDDRQRRDLIYKHLHKLLEELRRITRGDVTKAKQLADLLHCRAHAGENRNADRMQRIAEHRRDVAEAITSSLREFVHALHDAGGHGRYPAKIVRTQQVLATAVSRAAHYTKTNYKEIGDILGLDSRMIGKCAARFDTLQNDGNWEQLYDDRSAAREDATPEEWRSFALQHWKDPELGVVRASEVSRDTIRNPDDRSDKEQYRKHYLQKGIGEAHEEMLKAGKATYGDKFHMSMTYFSDLRPFYVKDATRDTCVCVYHMRWREFADGLRNYRQNLRTQKIARCGCSWAPNDRALRKQLLCERTSDEAIHDNIPCCLNRCEDCKDARRLFRPGCAGSLCEDEMRDPGQGHLAALVKFECYEKIQYTCKDGTVKEKKDFQSVELPFSTFKEKLEKYWPKFVAHHNDAQWHDDDFVCLKEKLRPGHVVLVIDFAENFSHQPRIEHQSKYFSQTQTTIVPVVIMFRVEDLCNITDERRAELIAYLDEHSLPRVVAETHFIISADMQHDNAFIRKVLDDFIFPYIKRAAPMVTSVRGRSDGCKAQFKCASHFDWVSAQSKEGSGLRVRWSFFASCHGKCYCDPEGGTLKNAARREELRGHEGELARAHILKTSWDFFLWARDKSGLARPLKALEQKHGKGIFRRFFYWIPAKGTGSVNRTCLPKFASAKGSSRLHEFVDIGVPGTVSTRRAACNKCQSCWSDDPGERRKCLFQEFCGKPMELRISREAVPTTSLSRVTRASLDVDAVARAATASLQSCVCIETHKDEQTFPWVLGTVVKVSHHAPQSIDHSNSTPRLDSVKPNELVLEVKLWEALEAGSASYKESGIQMIVPARRVRVVDVTLEPVRAMARATNNPHATTSQRFTISKESLQHIRAAMPSVADSWEVEEVVQYRKLYRVEQWLVKWHGYGEDHNTWEPWEHLLTEEARTEALKVKEQMLSRSTG